MGWCGVYDDHCVSYKVRWNWESVRVSMRVLGRLVIAGFLGGLGFAAGVADDVKTSKEAPRIDGNTKEGVDGYKVPSFPIGPFKKYEGNPIMSPDKDHKFEEAHLYNPTAIVLDDKVFLLYRAQNNDLESSIGLAWSEDGYQFTRLDRPIIHATEPWEQAGGTEDPRIIRKDGMFYVTYTGYDNTTARLCLATSDNLLDWKKYEPIVPNHYEIFRDENSVPGVRLNSSKSGAIIPEKDKNGSYNMIFGDSYLHVATSKDLIHWETNPADPPWASGVHLWENMLIEPGPAPIKANAPGNKYIFIYNAATLGNGKYNKKQYSTGQMLIDYDDFDNGPLARVETPILEVTEDNEKNGLVDNVVFSEGLVQFKNKWFLYFGQGDSDLGVATAPV